MAKLTFPFSSGRQSGRSIRIEQKVQARRSILEPTQLVVEDRSGGHLGRLVLDLHSYALVVKPENVIDWRKLGKIDL